MKNVDIYTDGACSGNPGIGGWCAVLIYNGVTKVISGYNKSTTNNRMELFAVISGLAALKEPCNVRLFSDSAYVVNAINEGWLESWKRAGWRTADKKETKNTDLWSDLSIRMQQHKIEFIKVKGHADNEYNNLCDKNARAEIEKCRKFEEVSSERAAQRRGDESEIYTAAAADFGGEKADEPGEAGIPETEIK